VLAICVPALLFISWRWRKQGAGTSGVDASARQALPFLQLSVPPGRRLRWAVGMLGGTMCGVGFFYLLSAFIAPIIERFFPVPPEERAHLMELLRPASGLRPLWQDLLCFAAVPALCEELLFRGALLTTLGARPWRERTSRIATLRAVLLAGILFGVFHVSLSKILPTALLGLGFGLAAVIGSSLWSAIAMHFANNAMVVLLIRVGLEEVPQDRYALIYSICALVGLGLGFALLRSAARPAPAPTPIGDGGRDVSLRTSNNL
jgi:membrane protease YdiL (CAAX protease family)